MKRTETKLLSAAVATGAGLEVPASDFTHFSFYINASSVTSGGTVDIEVESPNGDWVQLSTTAVSANGDTLVQKEGAFSKVRANVTARTDGTYTVSMTAR